MSCENVSSGIYGQGRPRSVCASEQSVQALNCPLPELLDTVECTCTNIEQMPGWYLAHAQNDVNIFIMFKGTFSPDEGHISI